MRWVKYKVAKLWIDRIQSKGISEEDLSDEFFRQKFTHLQGQIVSRGSIKWRWDKLIKRLYHGKTN